MDKAGVVRAIFEDGWNRQDFDAARDWLADEFEFHIGGSARTMDAHELRQIVATWHHGFSDFSFQIHSIVASGDRAAVHATLTGTNDGPWEDLDATGKTIHIEHMFFFRFEAGRVVEVWELLDRGELRRQLVGE